MRALLLASFVVCAASWNGDLVSRLPNPEASVSEMKSKAHSLFSRATMTLGLGGSRRNSMKQQCPQIQKMTQDPAQLKALMKKDNGGKDVPDSCLNPIVNFLTTACSPACQNSKMFNSPPPPPPGGRRLLGGIDTKDPASACKDPCFMPMMSSMMAMAKVMNSASCKAVFPPPSPPPPGGRRLLGGQDPKQMEMMEQAMGLMCSKNANGQYCMTIFANAPKEDGSDPLSTACKAKCSGCNKDACPSCKVNQESTACSTCANTQGGNCPGCLACFKTNSKTCPMAAAQKTWFQSLGCCWGTVMGFMKTMNTPTPSPSPPQMNTAHMNMQLKTCGLTLSSTPCQATGIKLSSVQAATKLGGVTAKQFDQKAQTQFTKGLATTAGVKENQVTILSYADVTRRASGLEVKSEIVVTGEKASSSTISAMKTKLSNKATLQANIKKSGTTALASSTVSSSASSDGFTVAAKQLPASSAGVSSQVSLAALALIGFALTKYA